MGACRMGECKAAAVGADVARPSVGGPGPVSGAASEGEGRVVALSKERGAEVSPCEDLRRVGDLCGAGLSMGGA